MDDPKNNQNTLAAKTLRCWIKSFQQKSEKKRLSLAMACCGWSKIFWDIKNSTTENFNGLLYFSWPFMLFKKKKKKLSYFFISSFFSHHYLPTSFISLDRNTAAASNSKLFSFFFSLLFFLSIFYFFQNKIFFCAATHFLIRLSFLEAIVVRKIIHNRW